MQAQKMIYRGREDRVHIADGKRAEVGAELAHELDAVMRNRAHFDDGLSAAEAFGDDGHAPLKLCPGCYMVALFNAAVTLAKENGQSLSELGNTLAAEFAALAAGGPATIESVRVIEDRAGVPQVYPQVAA